MSFKLICPHCGQPVSAEEDMVGETFPCPGCDEGFVVTPPVAAAPPAKEPGESSTAPVTPVSPSTRFASEFEHAILNVFDFVVGADELANIIEQEISRNGDNWPEALSSARLASSSRRIYFPYWLCGGSGSARWDAQVGTYREVQGKCLWCQGTGYGAGNRRCDQCGGKGHKFKREMFYNSHHGSCSTEETTFIPNWDPCAAEDRVRHLKELKRNAGAYRLVDREVAGDLEVVQPSATSIDRSLGVAGEVVHDALKNVAYGQASALGDEVSEVSLSQITTSDLCAEPVLVPVWLGGYRLGGKDYTFQVHGVTGRVWFQRPLRFTLRRNALAIFAAAAGAFVVGIGILWLVDGRQNDFAYPADQVGRAPSSGQPLNPAAARTDGGREGPDLEVSGGQGGTAGGIERPVAENSQRSDSPPADPVGAPGPHLAETDGGANSLADEKAEAARKKADAAARVLQQRSEAVSLLRQYPLAMLPLLDSSFAGSISMELRPAGNPEQFERLERIRDLAKGGDYDAILDLLEFGEVLQPDGRSSRRLTGKFRGVLSDRFNIYIKTPKGFRETIRASDRDLYIVGVEPLVVPERTTGSLPHPDVYYARLGDVRGLSETIFKAHPGGGGYLVEWRIARGLPVLIRSIGRRGMHLGQHTSRFEDELGPWLKVMEKSLYDEGRRLERMVEIGDLKYGEAFGAYRAHYDRLTASLLRRAGEKPSAKPADPFAPVLPEHDPEGGSALVKAKAELAVSNPPLPGINLVADRKMAQVDIPHPFKPLVIQPDKNKRQPGEFSQGPSMFAENFLISGTKRHQGRLNVKVVTEGIVFVATSIEYGSDRRLSGGTWKEEVQSREKLRSLGWSEVGAFTGGSLSLLVIAKPCKAGEEFYIRTRKYHTPRVLLPAALLHD